jgi:hypothetical protein
VVSWRRAHPPRGTGQVRRIDGGTLAKASFEIGAPLAFLFACLIGVTPAIGTVRVKASSAQDWAGAFATAGSPSAIMSVVEAVSKSRLCQCRGGCEGRGDQPARQAAELIVNAQLDQFVELPVAKEANIMSTSGTARGPLCSLRI